MLSETNINEWREAIPYELRWIFARELSTTKFMNEERARGGSRFWDRSQYFWNYTTDVFQLASQVLKEDSLL